MICYSDAIVMLQDLSSNCAVKGLIKFFMVPSARVLKLVL